MQWLIAKLPVGVRVALLPFVVSALTSVLVQLGAAPACADQLARLGARLFAL